MKTVRQQLLLVYMSNSALTSELIAWSLVDGADPDSPGYAAPYGSRQGALKSGWHVTTAATGIKPPYSSVLHAMRDGWRVVQVAPPSFPGTEGEQETMHFKYQVLLEKKVARDVE